MKYCSKCGELISDDAQKFCFKCGMALSDAANDEKNEEKKAKPEKQKKFRVSRIVSAIISVVIVSVMGQYSEDFTNYFRSLRDNHELNGYIEEMESYSPGICSENEYISEHFGLKFTADENWLMLSEEEIKQETEIFYKMKESLASTWTKLMEERNVKEELQEKFVNAIYSKEEMGAYYVDENDNVMGEVVLGAIYAFQDEDVTDFAKGIVEAMKISMMNEGTEYTPKDMDIEEKIIANEKHTVMKMNTPIGGVSYNFILRAKNGMICMMICYTLEGYEDVVMNSLLERFSAI